MIEIERPSQSSAVMRRVIVTMDGETVAKLRPGEVARVPCLIRAPKVQARMDWCHSNELIVNGCTEDISIRLRVEFAPFWQALLFSFIRPSQVLRLHRVEDASE